MTWAMNRIYFRLLKHKNTVVSVDKQNEINAYVVKLRDQTSQCVYTYVLYDDNSPAIVFNKGSNND